MDKIKVKNQYRTLDINSGSIDKEERTVDITFSSELAVERWFGMEILSHRKGDVNMSRLNDGAAVLENHSGKQIGVVVAASIEDGRGLAKIKFSKNSRGAEVFEDVEDGIVRNISVGYSLGDMIREDKDIEGIPTFRSKGWMPFEISVVGVPADAGVGIGRDKEDFETEINIEEGFRSLDKPEDLNETDTEEIDGDNSHKKARLELLKMSAKTLK